MQKHARWNDDHIIVFRLIETYSACHCICHENTLKLFIYVCGSLSDRLAFKLIDQQLINDVLCMKRFKNDEQR